MLDRGFMNRFYLGRLWRRIGGTWTMYPLGVLFGLGFDTATGVGLLAISAGVATHNVPVLAVLSLPILFAAGMCLMDTADGVHEPGLGLGVLQPDPQGLPQDYGYHAFGVGGAGYRPPRAAAGAVG